MAGFIYTIFLKKKRKIKSRNDFEEAFVGERDQIPNFMKLMES